MLHEMLGALVNLNHTGHYLHWGFIQISVANLVVILLMVVVFMAAVVIPFRTGRTAPMSDTIIDRPGDTADALGVPRGRRPPAARGRADVDRPPPGRGGADPAPGQAPPRPPAELRGVVGLHLRRS